MRVNPIMLCGHELSARAMSQQSVRRLQEGQLCHFRQAPEPERLMACWDGAKQLADFEARRAAVDDFNASSRCPLRFVFSLMFCLAVCIRTRHLNFRKNTLLPHL